MADSPKSNGFLVRFVGRNRIRDGTLESILIGVKGVLAPWLISDLIRERSRRKSWAECAFQLYSIGGHQIPRSLQVTGDRVRFVCISDTHMCHDKLPQLPTGDVLVHCGDFTNHGSLDEVRRVAAWLAEQPHPHKLVVPGNHDMILDRAYYDDYWGDWSAQKESHEDALQIFASFGIRLLIDETVEIQGLRIHGSPWVTNYAGWRTAFNKDPEAMRELWKQLSGPIDVLLTHEPPLGIGDRDRHGLHHGCPHLAQRVLEMRPRLHVFGHVHSDFGISAPSGSATVYVNAASVSDLYGVGGRSALTADVPLRDH